ncbi:3-isopropylmalate dehydratase small subunit 3 [Galdieria sulphuraria]|nr:3-isopropylmalate dehydratase small subunit 3 [Galdieria sulphuraria]
MEQVSKVGKKRSGNLLRGKVFVVRDNIDTDQIIPAEFLTLVPSVPEEYEKLGSYALVGLPEKEYPIRFIEKNQLHTTYTIIIAGNNFGCGSSREHAPIALGAAGAVAVVAKSYARIFFRNCSATGELYPWESKEYLVNHFHTGEEAEIDFGRNMIRNLSSKEEFELEPLGDVLPVIDAGGLFEYARQSGMIPKQS